MVPCLPEDKGLNLRGFIPLVLCHSINFLCIPQGYRNAHFKCLYQRSIEDESGRWSGIDEKGQGSPRFISPFVGSVNAPRCLSNGSGPIELYLDG